MAAVKEVLKSVLVSAPGKVILHGEHAVVYGKTAIATSVDLRCYLLLSPRATGDVKLILPDMQLTQTWPISELKKLLSQRIEGTDDDNLQILKRFCNVGENPSMKSLACLVLLYLLTKILHHKMATLTGIDILIYSQLPFGAGLGSSAAYSVCIAAGLLTCCGAITVNKKEANSDIKSHNLPEMMLEYIRERGEGVLLTDAVSSWGEYAKEDLELINKLSYEAETLVHGTPSGIDNSISVFGGAIKFKNGAFKQIDKMPSLTILLVYTKVLRNTKKMVARVRDLHDKYPSVISPLLTSIEEIVLKSETVLAKLASLSEGEPNNELYSTLQDLFTINHHLLNSIGVGHASLDKVHHMTSEIGLASKLTGAGGGGCAIALIPPGFSSSHLSEVKGRLEESGFESWETSIGGNGVRAHWIH
ncbi:PREDICTED: mevalonate kinase-like [Amphimedon queenslandica]|uniref:Mevalonate kinase n=1 Tax=Amphimedon queenslandica TaxID=400682 RepID=A0AAN0JJQ5_AMPQE|nr:PREDICTED: mevalonate kinase-like [Amphimedon queenslandica]|eukprot:XP_019856997.1 PREDICTED: mevalonate kinase-like [Amphimedon queenslandica]